MLIVLAVSAPARGATPDSGHVSADSPKIVWQGRAPGAPFVVGNQLLSDLGQPILCQAPFCDTFSLDVATSADLQIESSSCADLVTQIEVQKPDGSTVFADGVDNSPRTIIDLAAAPVGRYVVRTLVNVPVGSTAGYIGHATLDLPATTDTLPAPAIDVSQRAVLRVHTSRVSYRRAGRGRRLRVAVSTSAPVSELRATLRRGRVVVGSGRRRQLNSHGAIRLGLRRTLSPGAYRLQLSGSDGSRRVTTESTLRVSRAAGVRRARAASTEVASAASPTSGPSARC